MFCTKCGLQNPDKANFCKRCGAKLPQITPSFTQSVNPQPPTNKTSFQPYQPPINTQAYPNANFVPRSLTEKTKKFYYITLGLHLLSIILFFVPSLFSKAGYSGAFEREETVSMFELFTAVSFGCAFIIVVIKIASAFLTALPILNVSKKKTSKLLFPKIVVILELLWLLLSVIMMVSEASTQSDRASYSGLEIDASAGLTFGGCLYLLSLLALFIMLLITTSKSKKQ